MAGRCAAARQPEMCWHARPPAAGGGPGPIEGLLMGGGGPRCAPRCHSAGRSGDMRAQGGAGGVGGGGGSVDVSWGDPMGDKGVGV